MKIILCDVDGVVANLVTGFQNFTHSQFNVDFEYTDIVFHNDMGRSPRLNKVNNQLARFGGFSALFEMFMKDRDVYGKWIDPINGALSAIADLRSTHEIIFVTALMKSARDHFRSKMEWIERFFPDIQIMTGSSSIKHLVHGDYAIDDRYDTCMRWEGSGTRSFLFRQPWNECPVGTQAYNWKQIVEEIRADG